jgi:hypothetical protein
MSINTRLLRKAADSTLDALELLSYTEGFEAATNALDELSDIKHNFDEVQVAEILRWAARELRGENA